MLVPYPVVQQPYSAFVNLFASGVSGRNTQLRALFAASTGAINQQRPKRQEKPSLDDKKLRP